MRVRATASASASASASSPRCARYSLDKFRAFVHYNRTASTSRVVLVILCTPLTTLVASLVPQFVPLRDPTTGWEANYHSFLFHAALITWLINFGAAVQFRAGARVPHDEFSTLQLVVASCLATVPILAVAALVCQYWRFPIPFFWIVMFLPWFICFLGSHVLVSRGKLLQKDATRRKLYGYLPSFTIQISQVVIYPAFSAAFESANEWQKVCLTVLFPGIKYVLKKILRKFSKELEDFAEEVTVSGVEICASIYQSMIMQTTPSAFATAFVVGVDLLQGLVAVQAIMAKKSVVPQWEIVEKAAAYIERGLPEDTAEHEKVDLDRYASDRRTPLMAVRSLGWEVASFPKSFMPSTAVAVVPCSSPPQRPQSKKSAAASVMAPAQRDQTVLVHALEILQAAEMILLVEYLEVAIPVVNGIFLTVAVQLDTAVYSQKLYGFYYHRETLMPAQRSLALYISLQLLSMVFLFVFLRERFRLAPSKLLAFHLETHAWSLQGKMASWLAAFLQFAVLHYGTDFRFKFTFKMPTPDQ